MPSLLLIDTDPSFTYLMARYCQMCGCALVNVRTREEVDRVAEGYKGDAPALIVIHLTPPSHGAFALVQSLKRAPATASLPILLCGSSNDATGAWEAGVDHWLSKPVMLDDFRAVLQTVGIAMQPAEDQ